MNTVLPDRYLESIQRLALGLEPIDALRGERIGTPLDVAIDGVPAPVPRFRRRAASPFAAEDVLRRLQRHDSCRFVLLWDDRLRREIHVRISEAARRFVPRRLSITVPTLAQLIARELAPPAVPAMRRVRRPFLYPGAAYDISDSVTGARGRVTRAGKPMPWARIVAVRRGTNTVVGRAHGDDRGEFLLVVGRNEGVFSALPASLAINLTLTVTGPNAPVGPQPVGAPPDPLWGLPLEVVTNTTVPDDDVSRGITDPYSPNPVTTTLDVSLPFGRITSLGAPIAL
jgi:hypothetical protein